MGCGGWLACCQAAPGRHGTALVTIEDETGDVRVVAWRNLLARRSRELGSQVEGLSGFIEIRAIHYPRVTILALLSPITP